MSTRKGGKKHQQRHPVGRVSKDSLVSNLEPIYGGDVTSKPFPVSFRPFETEQSLEVILKRKVKCLGREISDDIGCVSSPERNEAFIPIGTSKSVDDTFVWCRKTTLLNPTGAHKYGSQTSFMESVTYISSWF